MNACMYLYVHAHGHLFNRIEIVYVRGIFVDFIKHKGLATHMYY